MARGGHTSPVATATALPKVSFQKIEDADSTQPSGVHQLQARNFGYNDFSEFQRPDQYIRHIEPLEIDLERQVEYDMDEQDQEWLDAVNAERKKEQVDTVSYEVFEVVMDRLEKEWFNLTKHIPKPDLALPSEDSTCAICDDSEGENSNAIVFCDGCNLAVHQDCYGVPYIPEGQWLCRKCTVSPENPVSCILCPNEGGAFKQTTQGQWIHLLCAIWVPETRVSNDVFMEPIIGVERISKQRWKLKCAICEMREGACIQCAKHSCFVAFHVTCARKDKLLLPMKSAQGSEPGALTCFCERHLPKEQADIREAALAKEEEEDEEQYNSTKLSKSARAYAKTYKPGPPLVPIIIIDRILQYISRTNIRKKPDFVALMCRYWSLKREARRGAPLLKRLHLEPWTASSGAKMQGEEEKIMKLEQLQHLRKDLEDLKNLTELSRKRESRKLKQAELIHDVLCAALFPHTPKLRAAFERIIAVDRQEHFKNPVSKKDVPDYFDIVKNPMSWINIESKLDNFQYWDLQSFKDDVHLVLDNAILYNKPGTAFHRTALRMKTSVQPILSELNGLSSIHSLDPNNTRHDDAPPPAIGDLEPPLEVLELLLSSDLIQDESEIYLFADPLTSLFNFELEKRKPNLVELEAEQRRQAEEERKTARRENDRIRREAKKEAEKIRKEAENEKRRLARQAQRALRHADPPAVPDADKNASLSAPPEIRVPRTRGAAAAAVASEPDQSEASGSISAPPRRPKAGSSSVVPVVPKVLRQRRSSGTSGARDIPLVENVDQRKSFTMFEQGWILPVGQRRGGRVPIDPSALPPPKKKMRLDPGSTSRLSVFSTAASENQTLQGSSQGEEPPISASADNSMDMNERPSRPSSSRTAANRSGSSVPSRLLSLTTATPERVAIPPPTVIRTPDGKVIIEELDTPAIRKEKSMRRKEERLAAAAAAADAALASSPMEVDETPSSPFTESESSLSPAPNGDADATSDLSDLSDVETDEERGEERGDETEPDESVEEQDEEQAVRDVEDGPREEQAGELSEPVGMDVGGEGTESDEPVGEQDEEQAERDVEDGPQEEQAGELSGPAGMDEGGDGTEPDEPVGEQDEEQAERDVEDGSREEQAGELREPVGMDEAHPELVNGDVEMVEEGPVQHVEADPESVEAVEGAEAEMDVGQVETEVAKDGADDDQDDVDMKLGERNGDQSEVAENGAPGTEDEEHQANEAQDQVDKEGDGVDAEDDKANGEEVEVDGETGEVDGEDDEADREEVEAGAEEGEVDGEENGDPDEADIEDEADGEPEEEDEEQDEPAEMEIDAPAEQADADAEQDDADAEQDDADVDAEQDDADGERDDADAVEEEQTAEQDEPEEEEEVEDEAPNAPPTPPSATQPVTRSSQKNIQDLGRVVIPAGQKRLEPGTLVWAKATSYPWWPAVVFDDKDPAVPVKVVQEVHRQRRKQKGKGDPLHIVRFFDKSRSWQFPHLDKMRCLGEVKALDLDMLSKNSTMQKKDYWKGNWYAECQLAYTEAMDEMESGDEKAKFMKA